MILQLPCRSSTRRCSRGPPGGWSWISSVRISKEDSLNKFWWLIYKWRKYLTSQPLREKKKNKKLIKDIMTGRVDIYSGTFLRWLQNCEYISLILAKGAISAEAGSFQLMYCVTGLDKWKLHFCRAPFLLPKMTR